MTAIRSLIRANVLSIPAYVIEIDAYFLSGFLPKIIRVLAVLSIRSSLEK